MILFRSKFKSKAKFILTIIIVAVLVYLIRLDLEPIIKKITKIFN